MTDKAPWVDDLLGFEKTAATFTALIKSIDDSKVISIEAGFGRGKTYFRTEWAKQLRSEGELVVEIDARQSDHSGDPVVTFIGALVRELGTDEPSRMEKAKKAGIKYGALLGRTLAKAVAGRAADELFDGIKLDGKNSDELLAAAVEGVGEGLSKFASETIAAQLVAEEARTKEIPEQLDALRDALTEATDTDRVVIIIDELDRCHPDYAIALLEAMKLIFDRPGYVFVLMVNSQHLERIAAHRFVGWHNDDIDGAWEPYLDKFVDMRLTLKTNPESIGEAAKSLFAALPEPVKSLGQSQEFTVERAAQLASELAPVSELSLRQIKRVKLRVELALRCYPDKPVDLPLLVWLAFLKDSANASKMGPSFLPRAALSPKAAESWAQKLEQSRLSNDSRRHDRVLRDFRNFERENAQALYDLPEDVFRRETRNGSFDYHKLLDGLAPWYIPEHEEMLEAVHYSVAD